MNTATDHFSAHVEDADYREPTSNGLEDAVHVHDESHLDDLDTGAPDSGKRKFPKIPTPLLIVGAVVVFGLAGMGYQKLTAKPQASYVASAPQANGGGMIPSTPISAQVQPGVDTQPPTLASPQAGIPTNTAPSTPLGPPPTVDHGSTMQPAGFSGGGPRAPGVNASGIDMGSAPGNNSGSATSAFTPGSLPPTTTTTTAAPSSAIAIAPDTQSGGGEATAPDPKDAVIAGLRAQIQALQLQASGSVGGSDKGVGSPTRHHRTHGHAALVAATGNAGAANPSSEATATATGEVSDAATTASKPVRAHKSGLRKGYWARGANTHKPAEPSGAKGVDADLAHLHIKQVIPGQGWVEDESTGKQQVVSVGDHIGNSRVTKIDPESYRIETTAGVIQ